MRIAIFTDVHANREALSACLAHARGQGAQRYAFLGDLVGYGGDPVWVLETVMHHAERGAVVVLGNHDLAVLDVVRLRQSNTAPAPRKLMHAEAREVIAWTADQLPPLQVDFLRSLPYSVEQDGLLFVHASAYQPNQWEYVRSPIEARRSLDATNAHITFCGHVHKPALYRYSVDGKIGAYAPATGSRVSLLAQHRYLAIPGAVGQPRDGNCDACYAVFDDVTCELSYFRVPYDYGAAARRVIDAGLPIVFAMRLIEAI